MGSIVLREQVLITLTTYIRVHREVDLIGREALLAVGEDLLVYCLTVRGLKIDHDV